MRYRRAVIGAAAGVAVLGALSGCSTINSFLHDTFPDQFGPQRDANGRVEAPVNAHSYYLEVGDCFSFPDPSDHNEVTIVPCAEDHLLQVIGQGELSLQEERTLGAQNAVSAKCADPFAAFEQSAPAGSHPDQEFLITQAEVDGRTVTKYSCAASLVKL